MKYFIAERQVTERYQKTAANKARADVEQILSTEAYSRIDLITPFVEKQTIFESLKESWQGRKKWQSALSQLNAGDCLILQFPLLSKNIFLSSVLKQLTTKGVEIVVLLHDLESLRYMNQSHNSFKRKMRLKIEEGLILKYASKIIAHNKEMKTYLISKGYSEDKIVSLQIFDYLHEQDFVIPPKQKGSEVIIAGNLDASKVGYLSHLSQLANVTFQLFGANYDESQTSVNLIYNGSFLPEELPKHLKGNYGLIWDGESIDSCTGVYGEYLQYNNPHKTSLYLSSGFPVIIWDKAALSEFVIKNRIGLVVSSLNELPEVLSKITEEDYQLMLDNVAAVSQRLREGYYLKTALSR